MIAISLPFRIDGYGRVASTTSTAKIWADRARTVVSTAPGERLMRPDFGCHLPADIMVSIEDDPMLIDGQIANSFATWLPTLTYTGVKSWSADLEEGTATLDVNYTIPNMQQDTPAGFSFIIS